MPIIVNLSSLHQLSSIDKSMWPFVELCNQYSEGYFSWSSPLFKYTNYAWVCLQYHKLLPLINSYKTGGINSEEFLNKGLEVFSFLKNKKDIDGKKLLAEAWNAHVGWDDTSTQKFQFLLSKGEPIYLISNSNPLNIQKLLDLLKQNVPGITWNDIKLPEQAASSTHAEPISLAQDREIYLFTSFQAGKFKEGTPGLIEELNNQLRLAHSQDQIVLISQYAKDLEIASKLGIQPYDAATFFAAACADVNAAPRMSMP